MHTPRIALLSSAVILMLCLSAGQTTAQEGDPGVLPAAQGTAFTYQGQLKDTGGKPITGTCDFQFGLWDALSGGIQVAGPVTPTVLVTEGLFNALVDFGAPAFDGNARWLAVAVKCSGDPAFTPLSPRQALTPAPYALYALTAARLPWGASWSGSGTGTGLSLSGGAIGLYGNGSLYGVQGQAASSGTGVYGTAPITGVAGLATADDSIGVYGRSNATSGYGLYGYAPIGTAGVYGRSGANFGYGLYGHATAATGASRGVYGLSDSTSGYGVYGQGNTGVYGYTSSDNGYAVRGFATAGSGTYGVYGSSSSTSGYGVYGSSQGTGVYGTGSTTGTVGIATAAIGDAYGLYGHATALSGYAYGVYGQSDSEDLGIGVFGHTNSLSGISYGVYGQSDSSDGRGVSGYASADSGYTTGVWGTSDSEDFGRGVFGTGHTGVYGSSHSRTGAGGSFHASIFGGVGVVADSASGNIIEGFGNYGDRKFYITNEGAVYADLYFNGGGADFAEMLPAEEALQPGDLLAIGPDGKLVKTTSAYQSSVAGVYSTQPGFVGGAADGQDTTGKIPLAVVGVVPMKVTAENGAIQPGDLLTASDTPGHAMKASPITVSGVTFYPSGVVVGKALEGLADGTGLISVLVTLQ